MLDFGQLYVGQATIVCHKAFDYRFRRAYKLLQVLAFFVLYKHQNQYAKMRSFVVALLVGAELDVVQIVRVESMFEVAKIRSLTLVAKP